MSDFDPSARGFFETQRRKEAKVHKEDFTQRTRGKKQC